MKLFIAMNCNFGAEYLIGRGIKAWCELMIESNKLGLKHCERTEQRFE